MTVDEEIPRTVGEAEASLDEMRARTEEQIRVLQEILADYKAMLAGIERIREEVARHEWTDRQIIDHITSACRHTGWLSTQVDVYRQTPGGWTEPWGEVDLATGEYRRRS